FGAAAPFARAADAAPTRAVDDEPARAAAPLALDIDEAARRAADASPLVRRARAARTSTLARRVEADLLLPSNPVVAASVGPTWTDRPNGPAAREVGVAGHLEQTIEVAGQRGARRAE